MSEAAGEEASESNLPKTVKDKTCPYCGQAFTSSSLGRHLDLYIREKNPKPPDGVHDIDAIRKLRGNITRRQARGSTFGRRDDSTPTSTPRPSVRRMSPSVDGDSFTPSSLPKEGQYAVDSTLSKFPYASRWEGAGGVNDLASTPQEGNKRPGMQRTVSKQVAHKVQLDVKQKLADAMDTARAAELALRELLSSWRAAKQQIDNNSTPFDFDPLALDFPALTLRCLPSPPTLFSSTQLPTPTSWAVQSPGQRENNALQAYFEEEFKNWRVACASATTVVIEDMPYPSGNGQYRDAKEMVKKAERAAETLEKQVNEHLKQAYAVWEALPAQRRNELWILELARGVGRKHQETEKMKEQQQKLEQENANLKLQIDQLNRSQQPKEYRILSPTTIPLDREVLAHAYAEGVKGARGVGFDLEDRHLDLGSVVTKAIERWKNVITSTRVTSGGMNAQRSLDQASAQTPGATSQNSPAQSRQPSVVQTPQLSQQPPPPPQTDKRLSTASTNPPSSEQTAPSTTTTGPPSIEETSDQDADAEMEDDDSFAMMAQSPVKPAPPLQPQAQLEVPRTRGPIPQQQQQQQQQPPPQQPRPAADMRFMMPNGTGSPVNRTAAMAAMTRSMPNMNMAAMQASALHGADMSMTMQGVRGDMYME
ncbi:hypothetical protein PT974_03386 [Cladobotryum mycophilum]|uniref:C2H2-type domain-containing protein n=1 Tax=Cladobotryum mycophilum TaxID=491253 RepID=A0ABR0ST90_9HYPO